MSLKTNVENLAQSVGNELKKTRVLVNGNAADLSALTTTAKTNLVAAINEVAAAIGDSGAVIDDGVISTLTVWSSDKTDAEIDARIAALVDAAPGALDTLNELAEALGNDPNFATTVTNNIASKVSLTGNETIAGVKTFSSAPVVPNNSFAIGKVTGLQTALDGKLNSVVAGTNVTIDNTDPRNPIINASGGGGGAVDSVNGKTGVVVLTLDEIVGDGAIVENGVIGVADNATTPVTSVVIQSTEVTVQNTTGNKATSVSAGDLYLRSGANRARITAPTTGGDNTVLELPGANGTLALVSQIPTVSAATTSAAGIAELSTDAEAIAGTDTGRVITPSNLAAVVGDSTTDYVAVFQAALLP